MIWVGCQPFGFTQGRPFPSIVIPAPIRLMYIGFYTSRDPLKGSIRIGFLLANTGNNFIMEIPHLRGDDDLVAAGMTLELKNPTNMAGLFNDQRGVADDTPWLTKSDYRQQASQKD